MERKAPAKMIYIIGGAVILAVLILLAILYFNRTAPAATFDTYQKDFERQDFQAIYDLLSNEAKSRLPEEKFMDRNRNIYQGIEAANIKIRKDTGKSEIKQGKAVIPFSIEMDTLAGRIKLDGYKLILTKDRDRKGWVIDWSDRLIFPQLEPGDKVTAKAIYPQRGEIVDRNGQDLAVNGIITTIGVVPSKFKAVQDQALPKMAQILDLPAAQLENKLKGAQNPDWFVPLVNLSPNDSGKAVKLTAIDGVQYQKQPGRVYPGGEAFGSLMGYVGPITEEELAKHKGEGYSSRDQIGQMGLEQVYEQRLRGEKGGEISIVKGQTKEVIPIANKRAKDGERIKLAIDLNTQQQIYNQMKGEAGAAAAINPKTGEILALVSSPAIDPNLMTTYLPDTVRKAWNSAAKSPYLNRFKAVYAPGSVFKLVTGAIGLQTGAIKPEETVKISGKEWQPNGSWGNHKVTRVDDPGKPINLQEAYIYSDNIYFAMKALAIGRENFSKEAKRFGIGETLPLDYPLAKSQLANDKINSDEQLADTGYGQGEVQLSPLNVALIYSSLANDGDIMTPVLELKDNFTAKVWKAKAIEPQYVPVLRDDLIQVVENPAGTGYTTPAGRVRLLGKTGTAELKKGASDTGAEENGWFVAMNTDNPRLVVAMLIEDVKTKGESHYVVPKVKSVFDNVLK